MSCACKFLFIIRSHAQRFLFKADTDKRKLLMAASVERIQLTHWQPLAAYGKGDGQSRLSGPMLHQTIYASQAF